MNAAKLLRVTFTDGTYASCHGCAPFAKVRGDGADVFTFADDLRQGDTVRVIAGTRPRIVAKLDRTAYD